MRLCAKVILSIFLGIGAQAANYPDEWWAPVPESERKSWEILPQDAESGQVILSKRTELGIFSNFAATPFVLGGATYASVEGFWQMMKYPEGEDDSRWSPAVIWPHQREEVANMVGFEAKRAGDRASENMKLLGIAWITYGGERITYKGSGQDRHYELIYQAIENKVKQNPQVLKLLLKTKGLNLRPDHHQGEKITPAYGYHEILMKIREQQF